MLRLLMDRMVQIPHGPDKDLRTRQHALLSITPGIHADKRAMRIVKVGMLDGFPDIMHLIRGERDLP